MASEIGKLFVTLGLDDKEFQKNLKNVEKNLKNVGKIMTGIGATIVAGFGFAIKSFAETGDELQKLAIKTGFSTETLSELGYAADISGASLQTIEDGVKRMSSAILDASDGMQTYIRSFQHLGLNVKQLQSLNPEEQFMTIAMALADVEDATTRAALAQDFFGRSGIDLLPLLAEGADGLANLAQEARDLGLVFDQESADAAAEFNDSLTRLKGSLKGIGNEIAQNILPILQPIIDGLKNIVIKIGEWMRENPELSRTLIIITAAVGALFAVFGPLLMMLPMIAAGFNMVWGSVGLVILAIMALAAVVVLIITYWDEIIDFLKKAVVNVANYIIEIIEAPFNAIIDLINLVPKAINALGGLFGQQWNIGEIPKLNFKIPSLAAGGLAMTPTLAMIGDNPAGEAVIPLDKLNSSTNGGVTIIQNIAGSVRSDRELRDFAQEAFLRKQKSNTSLGFV